MDSSRLVSVLIPAFNCANYVQEAIHSILNQSYGYFELLIWDDGSTDNTYAKIKEIQDSRIIIYRNENNLGYPATMNALFTAATGAFILIQDADDIADPYRIEKLVQTLNQNPDIDLAGSHLTKFYPNGKELKIISDLNINHLNRSFTNYTRPGITFGTLLMRKHVTKIPFRDLKFVTRAQDIDWLFRVSEQYQFMNCDEYLYYYRQHDESMSNANKREGIYNYFFWEYICFISQCRREKSIDLLSPAYEKQLRDFLNALIETKKNVEPNFLERHLAYRAKRNGQLKEALTFAWQIIKNNPLKRAGYQCLYKVLFFNFR